jgi:acyl carrier protein
MIELDMDIESDLGIDSIKRVEILSAFESKMPDMPPVSADAMGTLKTLRQTIEYINSLTEGSQDKIMETETSSTNVSLDVSYRFPSKGDDETAPVPPVERRVIRIQKTPAPTGRAVTIPEDSTVFITDDKSGLGKNISDLLSGENINTKLIPSGRIEDLYSHDSDISPAGGLIIIPDVDLLMDRFDKKNLWNEKDERFIKQSF